MHATSTASNQQHEHDSDIHDAETNDSHVHENEMQVDGMLGDEMDLDNLDQNNLRHVDFQYNEFQHIDFQNYDIQHSDFLRGNYPPKDSLLVDLLEAELRPAVNHQDVVDNKEIDQLKDKVSRLKAENERVVMLNAGLYHNNAEIFNRYEKLQARDRQNDASRMIKTEVVIKYEEEPEHNSDAKSDEDSEQDADEEECESCRSLQKQNALLWTDVRILKNANTGLEKDIEARDSAKRVKLGMAILQRERDEAIKRADAAEKLAVQQQKIREEIEAELEQKNLEVDPEKLDWCYELDAEEIIPLKGDLQKSEEKRQTATQKVQSLQAEVLSLQKGKKEMDERFQDVNKLLKAKSAQLNVLQHKDSTRVVTRLQDKLREAQEQIKWGATMEISRGGNEILDVSVSKLKVCVYSKVPSVHDIY